MTERDDDRLGELLRVARTLPREVTPPAEVWGGIEARIARRRAPRRWVGWIAAAAAIVMLAGTAVLIPAGDGPRRAKAVKAPGAPPPAVVASVERQYASTLAELDATMAAERVKLAPGTATIVEQCLGDIDVAIAETRDALRVDPSNEALVGILASHYERKVDLLQRATELGTSF